MQPEDTKKGKEAQILPLAEQFPSDKSPTPIDADEGLVLVEWRSSRVVAEC